VCLIIAGGHNKQNTAKAAKVQKTTKKKKKSDAYGKVGIRRLVLFMLHHQIDGLRSFVLLHDSPSARLADRVLMIHELRGSNPTPYEVPHILCSFIVRFRLSRVSCFVLSFYNSALIPNSHTQVLGHFLSSTHSTLAFCYQLEKTRLSLVSTPEFWNGGRFGKDWNA
jgi:hypothetical protein